MERYIHNANLELYRRLLEESKRDPSRDEDRHNMLLCLLAEEEAKDKRLRHGYSLADALTGRPVCVMRCKEHGPACFPLRGRAPVSPGRPTLSYRRNAEDPFLLKRKAPDRPRPKLCGYIRRTAPSVRRNAPSPTRKPTRTVSQVAKFK
jgi:hypothetical protein